MQAKLLEHNVRFGDPECQCMMMRLETDLLQVLLSAASGQLQTVKLKWTPDASLCVVMAAEGYPGSYKKGTPINGLEAVKNAKVHRFREVGLPMTVKYFCLVRCCPRHRCQRLISQS